MKKATRTCVAVMAFMLMCGSFMFFHIVDMALIYSIFVFIYEFIIGNFLIIYNASFSILRCSILYLLGLSMLIFVVFMRYNKFRKIKIFGIDFKKYNSQFNYLVFIFNEYYYSIIFISNFLLLILLLYHIMHKDFLIIGIIISFYMFIGLSIYIKKWLIKNDKFNEKYFNMCLNTVLGVLFGWYLMEAGEAATIAVGVKTTLGNWGDYFNGFIQQKDKLLINLKHDKMCNNYKWWNLHDLYKNQKASLHYLYLKKQIINNNLLTEITNKNKHEYFQQNIKQIITKGKTAYQIQENKMQSINLKNNNIYTDKNMVHYEQWNQQIINKLNYSKYIENKNLNLFWLNMKGLTSGDFTPRGTSNKLNLILLLDKENKSVIYNLNKILLDQKTANSFNTYLYLQNKYNNQHHFFDMLLDKNLNTKNLLLWKFSNKSVLYLTVKDKNVFFNKESINDFNKEDFNKESINDFNKEDFNKESINDFNKSVNKFLYNYNHFLNWWEKKNYIINKYWFKEYNVKKYVSLSKYHFHTKNAFLNVAQKDADVQDLKPVKNFKIQDVKFKYNLTQNADRNALMFKYTKTAFNNKLKLFNIFNILNMDSNYNIIKTVDNKIMFLWKQIEIYKPSIFQNWMDNWMESSFLKYIYLKYYTPKIPEISNFKLNNSTGVLYSEHYNNKYFATFKTHINNLNVTEYQRISKSFAIYNYLLNNSMNSDFNNKIDNIELKMNTTKQIYSLFFKDTSYNSKHQFSNFKYTYGFRINLALDFYTYKNYITQIATNIDTDTSSNLYFQKFLFKTADYLAYYYCWNKISYGEILNNIKELQLIFNKYSILESYISKRAASYNFNSQMLKNTAFDKSIYLKAIAEISNAEERAFFEKLMVLENHRNIIYICNLAYDTSIAMEHKDLNMLIDERESYLLFKGEFKSCNKVAAGLKYALNDLNARCNRNLNLLQQIHNVELEELNVDCLEYYKEIKDMEQQQRFLLTNYTEEELALLYENIDVQEDKEEFYEVWNFDSKVAIKELLMQKYLGEKYIVLNQLKSQLNLLDTYCLGLEELLQDVTDMREADQLELLEKIENDPNLKLLKEIASKRDAWLEEEHHYKLQQVEKVTNKLIYKDWDFYNQTRFKNEIMLFKKK